MNDMISWLLFLCVTTLHFLPTLTINPNNITAVFAFGDEFYDSGNNNNIRNICNANHKPYVDNFPRNAPMHRFSDSKLPDDLVIKYLDHKKLLRSSDVGVGDDMFRTGVNFALACSGLQEATVVSTKVLGLPNQFGMFGVVIKRIKMAVRKEMAAKTIQSSLYLIVRRIVLLSDLSRPGLKSGCRTFISKPL